MGHAELQPEDIDESITAFRGALKRTWTAFCATTSIHGLKYTKDEDTSRYVRWIWILIMIIMFICAILMVLTFYVDYRSNPTRMNVENDHAPISSILFPPTTICPEIMYNLRKSRDYLNTLILPQSTTTSDVLKKLEITYGFMYDDAEFDIESLNMLDQILELNGLQIKTFMQQIIWDCNDLIYRCRFKDEIVPCDTLFQVSQTFNGFCCSFNLNQTYIKFTNRYAHAGHRNGLSLILKMNDITFNYLESYSQGFKVMIQEANAFPSAHSVINFIPLNEEHFLSIRPIETFCSQSVKDLSFEERQCIFPLERPLQFFRHYVGANCELNCRVTMMLRYCGCYTYFFHSNLTQDRICTYRDIPCLVENFANIIGRVPKTQCPCWAACEKMAYDIQATSSNLQYDIPTIDKFYAGIRGNVSVVHITMSSQVYRRVRHDLLSNMVTLVSNLGSAFSLFVGMSMVSAVEILYYFTVILRKFYKQECKAREALLLAKNSANISENVVENTLSNENIVNE